MSAGSVIALNTSSRGASNSLVIRISRSDGRVTFVVALFPAGMLSFLSFQVSKDLVQLIESLVQGAAIGIQPGVELLEGLRTDPVDPLLADRMDFDEPGIAQNAKVLGDLWLAEPQPLDDLSYRQWLPTEELDDLQPVRFSESAQDLLHELIYTPNSICLSRHMSGHAQKWQETRIGVSSG